MADESSPSESYPKSARLTAEEQRFLNEMNMDFSTFTHEAIDERKKKYVKMSKKQKINKAIANCFFVILGLLFFMALGNQSNLIVIAIVGGLGAMFSIMGGVNLYLGMREEGMFVRKQK